MDFDGYRYDQWKTSEPDYTDAYDDGIVCTKDALIQGVPCNCQSCVQDEQPEPDWDSINDAAREDALAEKNDPHYWD